jgi:hypothetical protein
MMYIKTRTRKIFSSSWKLNENRVNRKVLCRTLRYFAHLNGASIVFSSKEEEALVTRVRTSFSSFF